MQIEQKTITYIAKEIKHKILKQRKMAKLDNN